MSLRATGREGGGHSNDQTLARLGSIGNVDLVARVLAEELDARNGVADLDLREVLAVDLAQLMSRRLRANLPWLRVWSGSIWIEERLVEVVYGRVEQVWRLQSG